MSTLRVELEVRDYDTWRNAFAQDAGGRQRSGARRFRIFRPVDDARKVMIDLDIDTAAEAGSFLAIMQRDVWPSPDKAPAKVGAPRTHILEMVESEEVPLKRRYNPARPRRAGRRGDGSHRRYCSAGRARS